MRKPLSPYLPGILLFLIAMVTGLLTYQDYGISWDELFQRGIGTVSYDYVFNGKHDLLINNCREYGVGFEVPLVMIEKALKLTDARDIYLMRHLVTHLFFLFSALMGYILVFRLFRSKFLACMGFVMIAFAPRMYAHSYFNTKDIPYLCMMIIILAVAQLAFDKNKKILYLLLGMICGYTTSIRIMGIMPAGFVLFFLAIDTATAYTKKDKHLSAFLNMAIFLVAYLLSLYATWPYLWTDPINRFIESYVSMSHFNWGGKVLLNGKFTPGKELDWTYFPTWFLISNPVLYLIAGASGLVLIVINFTRKPLQFLRNTPERNFLLYLMCFVTPILVVIISHSVLYDDWRHLYFVYPPFILMGLYLLNKIYNTKFKAIVYGASLIQVGAIAYFLIKSHPVQQVYFNELVSHEKEYLRKHYELDYWGASFKQALDYVHDQNKWNEVKICCNPAAGDPMENNISMLQAKDRKYIKVGPTPEECDYFITDFRYHPEDYPYTNPVFSITVQNSTVICVYKMH